MTRRKPSTQGEEGFHEQRKVSLKAQSQEHNYFWEIKTVWYD